MAQNTQNIDSLTNQAISGQVSPSSPEVAEKLLRCQNETRAEIQKLEARAANAKSMLEKMSCNLRVKGLSILIARLESVCGKEISSAPTDEEVKWAKKLFGLEQ